MKLIKTCLILEIEEKNNKNDVFQRKSQKKYVVLLNKSVRLSKKVRLSFEPKNVS